MTWTGWGGSQSGDQRDKKGFLDQVNTKEEQGGERGKEECKPERGKKHRQ